MAEEKVGIKIEVDGSQATKAVGSIRKELKEATVALQQAQAQFGEYSAEAITAAKRVAELRDRVSEAAETARLFDPGQKFAAFSGALNAVAGGFSAVQGALGLVGVESEEVQKQLLKVQSALALSQGLNVITDSAKDFQRLGAVIKQTETFQRGLAAANVVTSTALQAVGVSATTTSVGFKVLRGAIVATGIGALAVGLVLLVQNFDKVRDAVYRFIPGLKTATEFIGGLVQSVTDFIGITSEADRATAKLIADNSARIKAAERDLELNGDKYDQYTQRKIKANIDYRKSLEELTKEIPNVAEREKLIAQARAKADREIARADEDRNNAAEERRKADQKKADDAAKVAADKRKAEADRLAGIEKQALDELQRLRDEAAIAAIKDEDQRQIKAIEIALQREQERIKALEISETTRTELLKASTEKADREIQAINQARIDAEIKAAEDQAAKLAEIEAKRIEDERKAREEAAQLRIEDTLKAVEDERATFDQRRALIEVGISDLQRYFEAGTIGEREYTQTLAQYTQAREDIRAAEKASLENTVGAYAQVFGQISQLLGKNTAAGKAAAIAEATINTYLSASKAFQAMSNIPPAPVFGVIAAGVATAAGIKNIREIAKVQVPNGGGGGAVSTPSISAPQFSLPTSTAPIAPPRPQVAVTQLDRTSMQGINVASTRAYVVESDITGAQERITRLNRAARLA